MPDELRPITALFADVVGSTSLGERLAPDEAKALIGECVNRMSRAVEEFGGTVQAYQGDGICAYFGVPHAHADDPERAALAALRIVELVGGYGADVRAAWGISDFNVRVGVNSGPAAVGVVGAANPQAVALGDTTNVAARLESSAPPGGVLVGDATATRLAGRFVLEPRGAVAVKGRAEPVRAWRLIRAQRDLAGAPATPLVGRADELERVRDVLDDAVSGRGGILLVAGEAGLGKARLLAELRTTAADRALWLEGRCSSYGGDRPYGPFVDILRAWLGVEEGEPEIAVRTKARAKLGALLGGGLDELMPYFARLLAIKPEAEAEQRLAELPRDRLAAELRAAYATWIDALARERPIVLVLADAHWADTATRELAEELLPLTDRAPLLLVASFTPDPASEAWRLRLKVLAEFSHRATDVMLGPLPDDAAADLLRVFLPGGLDDGTISGIVARAEGNPLYLQELLRALVEGGAVQRSRTWTVTVGTADLLPPALENLLIARIDRLPEPARQLAQTAAVVGRSFPISVLEHVTGGDVADDLAELLRSELVREERRYPELVCAFRHGLVHEAALSTLTTARRRDLCGRVAAAFEQLYASSLDEHLERLAHYFARSDDPVKARTYLERAAARADSLDAHEHAATLRERAERLAG